MPFSFRLQTVLDYRRTLADRRRAEVAASARLLRIEEDILAGLHAAHEHAMTAYPTGANCPVDVVQSEQLTIHIHELETSIATQAAVVEHARAAYESARSELLELEKSAKSLEKLRDRQMEEFQAEAGRRERTDASEIASTFHRRFRQLP